MQVQVLLCAPFTQSRLGKAVNYFLNEYMALVGYLRDGRFEIDSNLVENDVRPSAVGKRRWLFIGHPDAGWRTAVIHPHPELPSVWNQSPGIPDRHSAATALDDQQPGPRASPRQLEASPGLSGEVVEKLSAHRPGDPGVATVSPPPLTKVVVSILLDRSRVTLSRLWCYAGIRQVLTRSRSRRRPETHRRGQPAI